MPKQLLIIRHAKSDWNYLNFSDFDRPLNDRGNLDAPEMAQRLVEKNIIPQQIISSPAVRAYTTACYFADAYKIEQSEIIKQKDIYEASVQTLLRVLTNLDNHLDFIAIFGHNPGLTNLVRTLCDKDLYNIPACGMAMIKFPFNDWKMVSAGTGELIFFDHPENEL